MAAGCRVFTHSVADGSWLEDKIEDMGIRCVFLVLDGINLDVWLAYTHLTSMWRLFISVP